MTSSEKYFVYLQCSTCALCATAIASPELSNAGRVDNKQAPSIYNVTNVCGACYNITANSGVSIAFIESVDEKKREASEYVAWRRRIDSRRIVYDINEIVMRAKPAKTLDLWLDAIAAEHPGSVWVHAARQILKKDIIVTSRADVRAAITIVLSHF